MMKINDLKKELAAWFADLFEQAGIDPIYAAAVICILITAIAYWPELKQWDKAPRWKKGLAKSAIFASIVLIFASLLRFIGAF